MPRRKLPKKLHPGDPRYIHPRCTPRRGFLCYLLLNPDRKPADRKPVAYEFYLPETRVDELRNVLCPYFDRCLHDAADHEAGLPSHPRIEDMHTWVCSPQCPHRKTRAPPFTADEIASRFYRRPWPIAPPEAPEFHVWEFRNEVAEKEDQARTRPEPGKKPNKDKED